MPAGMDFPTAASFILTYATSEHALCDRGALKAGETLLVLGAAGGVGLAAIEIGKALGARVIACASTRRQAGRLPRARRRRDDQLHHRGSARADQGDHRRQRRRRRLRRGRRRLHRAGAAVDRLARTAARRRVRGRRHPEDSAQPHAAQGLLDRRRVLGRLHAPRAGALRRERAPARAMVRSRAS